ncbi:hypothetical protein M231_05697 [Tremella mesenterica]|uniref:Uncharacterized protein n=1 Tax=Tremella mesenterica TaxID=5217 RepID=A0A4Q1BHF7_TREME|nr:uncharacterized protein TREMEDRAFT_62130 [Tremella mesenterica DSM 1558]EIW69273.1 hypothetical protein TREMEDRAFT_62130 [Tremella mesenterica DSM 1558]RXK37038.1 hypothetical protein M231_05697 [Tremella mesenterica]
MEDGGLVEERTLSLYRIRVGWFFPGDRLKAKSSTNWFLDTDPGILNLHQDPQTPVQTSTSLPEMKYLCPTSLSKSVLAKPSQASPTAHLILGLNFSLPPKAVDTEKTNEETQSNALYPVVLASKPLKWEDMRNVDDDKDSTEFCREIYGIVILEGSWNPHQRQQLADSALFQTWNDFVCGVDGAEPSLSREFYKRVTAFRSKPDFTDNEMLETCMRDEENNLDHRVEKFKERLGEEVFDPIERQLSQLSEDTHKGARISSWGYKVDYCTPERLASIIDELGTSRSTIPPATAHE